MKFIYPGIRVVRIQFQKGTFREQLDLDDFQIKKVDEDKSEMPKFNIQLNHVQRNSENQNQQEEINPFQVNLKERAIYNLIWSLAMASFQNGFVIG